MVEGEIHRLLFAAFAPNTHQTYKTGWRAFCAFKHQRLCVNSPASVQSIREFVAWLSLRQLAPATIATYVSGVGYYHKIQGWQDPTQDFLVAKLLEGCRRDHVGNEKRLPLTLPVLSRLLQALTYVCSSEFEVKLFRAVMLSAFFGFMRIGEFAAKSQTCLQENILLFSDVQFCDLGMATTSVVVSFRHSKNNQSGPPQRIRLVQSVDRALCPVTALVAFAAVRPHLPGSFFCHFGGSPLTQYQFNAMLKKVLAFVGMGGALFRAHSFRIGAATTAFALGIPLDGVRSMGRWRSDAVQLYIRPVVECQMPGV